MFRDEEDFQCIELTTPTGIFDGKPYWQFSLFGENFELLFEATGPSWTIDNIAVIGQPPNNGTLWFSSKDETDCPTDIVFDYENGFITDAITTECIAPLECFLLINCSKGEELIYSGSVLNEYIDKVIQVNIDGVIKCFSVQQTQCPEESSALVFNHIILDCFDINECLLCLPKPEPIKKPKLRYVQPGYTTALCDPDKVEKIKCTFADLMYQQAMSRRFNIKFCCPKDLGVWQLRHEKINLDLIKYLNPTPDPCNPICKTYAYQFEANQTGNIVYTNCDNISIVTEVAESNEPQRFDFCALDYPGVTINITNSLGVVVDTFTIQPIENECAIPKIEIYEYRLTVNGAPNSSTGSLLSYIDENGLPINPLIEILLSKTGYELIFCAEYGSITLNGMFYYATNEPCPTPPCVSFAGLLLERIGDCLA